eukprot:SAG11_NODE_27953_length_326_cov_56.017621_1_plen_35_part_10
MFRKQYFYRIFLVIILYFYWYLLDCTGCTSWYLRV